MRRVHLVGGILGTVFAVQGMAQVLTTAPATEVRVDPVKHLVYTRLLDPREHPDDARRRAKPPSWETFGNQVQFTSLRGLEVTAEQQIVNYKQEMDKYTKTHNLGNVLWLSYPVLFGSNLPAVVDEINARELFLFDIWGYVPGSGPGGYWQQFKVPAGVFEMLESKLGDRWLGMDIGEQDGRYIGGYAPAMHPISGHRFEQYLAFQRHFQRMGDELGNRLSTLVSLNFGHYLLKEGVYTLIGAETAQGLPNAQVYYAWIRGAGKQYGVPWFGNASVYNRWGWKSYESTGADFGPTKGTSLSLLKRLMYSHMLYNSMIVGFESGFFKGNELTAIGKIQQAAHEWSRRFGAPGVMQTPVAVMTGFDAGWTFPRHLYTGEVYRVWGNLPYGQGDYLTDNVLDLLYPGYTSSSYFHDETGFLTPTPYGDIADCLLSDAPLWLLERYPLLIITGELQGGYELYSKLTAYMEGGGHLVITAGNLGIFRNLGGLSVGQNTQTMQAGSQVVVGARTLREDTPFSLQPLQGPPESRVIAECAGVPAAVELAVGKGRITALASLFGISSELQVKEPITSHEDQPLPRPLPMLRHVRAVLDRLLRERMLFEVGDQLSLIICRREAGLYTLGIGNNSWTSRPLKIVSHCGTIESITESQLDRSERTVEGFTPPGLETAELGTNTDDAIAGGDVRIFTVKVREHNVQEIAHVKPTRHAGTRILPIRRASSIKEAVLARPTFFQHFDGVLLDWRDLHRMDPATLKGEASWITNQGLRVMVDLTSGINLYPDLRLVNNDPQEYAASLTIIEDVLSKMATIGAGDLIFALHRVPENNISPADTQASFAATIRELCGQAAGRHITLHLRAESNRPPGSLAAAVDFVQAVNAPNLKIALSIASLIAEKTSAADATQTVGGRLGLWLASSPDRDPNQKLWSLHRPIFDQPQVRDYLTGNTSAPVVLDVVYDNLDLEFADARELDQGS